MKKRIKIKSSKSSTPLPKKIWHEDKELINKLLDDYVKDNTFDEHEYEYRCIEISKTVEETQDRLNAYAKYGWRVVCSYANHNYFLILERKLKYNDKQK